MLNKTGGRQTNLQLCLFVPQRHVICRTLKKCNDEYEFQNYGRGGSH
jgi:hypothetical protein